MLNLKNNELMMNKNINLSVGVLALIVLISYFRDSESVEAFGLSINVWVLRLVWLFIALVNFITYFKKMKESR